MILFEKIVSWRIVFIINLLSALILCKLIIYIKDIKQIIVIASLFNKYDSYWNVSIKKSV